MGCYWNRAIHHLLDQTLVFRVCNSFVFNALSCRPRSSQHVPAMRVFCNILRSAYPSIWLPALDLFRRIRQPDSSRVELNPAESGVTEVKVS